MTTYFMIHEINGYPCMILNKIHIIFVSTIISSIPDHLISLSTWKKKQVLQCINSKVLFLWRKLPLIENLSKHSWLCYCPVEVSSTTNQSFEWMSIDSTVVFRCKILKKLVKFPWKTWNTCSIQYILFGW